MLPLVHMLCRAWRCVVRGPGAPEPPARTEEIKPEHAGGDAADDLTAIRGIGIVTQNRLNQAGIKSYAQLAHTEPEELRKILSDPRRGAGVEKWIERARELAARQ